MAMHAEFIVRHSALSPATLKTSLAVKFRIEDRKALKNSPLFGSGEWDSDRIILYSTETPEYRFFCVPIHDKELQIYVEFAAGNGLEICESVWRGMKKALNTFSPNFPAIRIVDEDAEKTTASAKTSCFRTSLRREIVRRETVSPLMVSLAAIIYAIIGLFTFASKNGAQFLAGAVTGLVAALVALVLALVAAKEGKLSWCIPGDSDVGSSNWFSWQ
jgi:hypothetical protein